MGYRTIKDYRSIRGIPKSPSGFYSCVRTEGMGTYQPALLQFPLKFRSVDWRGSFTRVKKSVSAQEFCRACREGWRPQLVDVRSESEFAAGHIPGAINIPITEMDARCGDLNPALPLVLVSRSSARAELAAKMLASRHACITLLAGGTAAWVNAGFALVSTRRTRWSVERQARLAVGAILLTSLGLAHFFHPYWLFVAGAIGVGLVTAGLTDVCFMGTLMGKMPWNGAPVPPPSNDLHREPTEIPAT